MSVIEQIEQKIENYLDEQSPVVQESFLAGDFESIKQEIDFKVYIAQKLIDKGIEIDDDSISYQYISLANSNIVFDTNKKLSYKNQQPFFFINQDNFTIDNCYKDSETNESDIIFLEFLLLSLNQNWDELNDDNKLWFFIPDCEIDEKNLESFVQFILLTNGETFHNPIEIEENQFLEDGIKNTLECNTKSFNQYQESAYILSEYNHTKDILLRYLLLYHIIENFMYRRPIAQMANTKFTIRDFKRLYKHVDFNEIDTLSSFFKEISDDTLPSHITIECHINNLIEDLRNQELLYINNFIDILGFDFSNLKYIAGQKKPEQDFRRFIYQIRNSIVHNKETEFHITHNTFQEFPQLIQLFTDCLFPILENIIYFLIFKEDSIIDYPKNHLLLYGENCEN